SAVELDEALVAIRDNGMYPWVATAEKVQRHTDDAELRDALFSRLIDEEVERWVKIADDRLERDDLQGFVMPGNDDPWSIDAMLESGRRLVSCEPVVAHVGRHEMVSCGFANPTPWNSPRELDEDALYARLKAAAERVEDVESSIFNFHVP